MHTLNWIENEFLNASFRDNRLVKRLISLTKSLFRDPENSIPGALRTSAAVKAAYRFFSNPKVKMDTILMEHKQQTIERIKDHKTVLIIQDTTTHDHRTHPSTKGLGTYATSKDALGLLDHTTIAVTPEGLPLGVLTKLIWTRDSQEYGKRETRKTRQTSEKESQKWIESLEISLKDIPENINAVTVCDREADIYDLFLKAVSLKRHVLVRVTQNRKICEDGKFLVNEITNKPIMGNILTNIPRNPYCKMPAREANLAIKYCPVTIKLPKHRAGLESLPNLNLWVVLAQELNPPENVEPIYWLLLTTIPVESLEQAIEKIRWYKQRWKIERYFYTLKVGCTVEKLQLETVDGLKNAIGVYSIIAWKLLWLKYESEKSEDSSCEIILQQHEWQSLYCVVNNTPIVPKHAPTLKEAVLLIAKLGGFLNRNGDGNPGIKVIWRGLRRLSDISQAWLIAKYPVSKDVGNV